MSILQLEQNDSFNSRGSLRPMNRAYYSANVTDFVAANPDTILGEMTRQHGFALDGAQRDAWLFQVQQLKEQLGDVKGKIYFEFSIPRMGKRVDVLLISGSAIFILEYKVGSEQFFRSDKDQVTDYALDLSNFHEGSHHKSIIPVLVASNSDDAFQVDSAMADRNVFPVQYSNGSNLSQLIRHFNTVSANEPIIDIVEWESSGYKPTPTIIEATLALYNNHSVEEISRRDADEENLTQTSEYISKVIRHSKANSEKSIIFITGVPGAGKTLVGLNIATQFIDKEDDLYSVFLSGNGPLVSILQEALARNKRDREDIRIGEARSEVKAFIQNVHHFRDDGLADKKNPPPEHVVLFDEAQRAWNKEQTISFMRRKKGIADFDQSEPEFLISCMDRHSDWAVVVCLVGGGQEINSGEAGITGWLEAISSSYPDWRVYASDELGEAEYGGRQTLERFQDFRFAQFHRALHLKSSMRSFRSEKVSGFVKSLLDRDQETAKQLLEDIAPNYPIVVTRSLDQARAWLKKQARGSERYGIVVSSQAERLKPIGVHIKAPVDPVKWFLEGKDHTRSSYYLEEVATEFHVQGLELDWVCVAWDADFRFGDEDWSNWSFKGNKWQRIKKPERKLYQKNAYRVLLTRARQGMVIVVPEGSEEDFSRQAKFYDQTFAYLKNTGIKCLSI